MFGLSPWHLTWLVLVGLVVFGPDRLPSLLKDLGKALRQVRHQALAMQEDLKAELGPEVGDLDLRSLHPRTFVEKHLFGDEEDPLGLDFLSGKEPIESNGADSHPGMSLEKAADADVPASATGTVSIEKPAQATETGLKYDLDAT